MDIPALRCATRTLLAFVATVLSTTSAQAVIVRGTVTTPLGAPLGNARVQLIQGRRTVAFGFSQMDGSYEIRSTSSGRFVLLTSAAPYMPSVGRSFHGSRLGVVTQDVVMNTAVFTQQLSTAASGMATSVDQVAAPVVLTPQESLATEANLLNALRQGPGVNVVQTGQVGGPVSLYVRGGGADANKIVVDGVPAAAIGGRFDFSTLSTAMLEAPEMVRGANGALYGTGAEAATVAVETARGSSLRPVLNYTGDAGNFHSYRNEAVFSGTYSKLDYLGGFSRMDTSNAVPNDRFHIATSAADFGYSILDNTQARFTLRNGVSAAGLPGPHDVYGISALGKQADQNLISGLSVENRFDGNLHTFVGYGIVRSREQVGQFAPVGQAVALPGGGVRYYGLPVSLRGANGYTATGQAGFFAPAFDVVSNRDELTYQTDYMFPHRIAVLFGFQYENERGRILNVADTAVDGRVVKRTNYLYTFAVQGDIKHRFFYSLGGGVEDNDLYGIAGTPRIGLVYAPVLPGHKIFHGTRLRANVATGVQEPGIEAELTSLRSLLLETNNQAAIAAYDVAPIAAERSRTYDLGVDQNIFNEKLIFKAGYFHNVFDHQLESIGPAGLTNYFGIPAGVAAKMPAASLNSLAYRAQGFESELQYRPFSYLFLNGGYTYLASIVLQSFSNDAAATNPEIPGVAIGALSPLVGSRPFRRPPNTGFFAVQFSSNRFSAAMKGAFVGRSDDSTFQLGNDLHGGNSLLLPNRNLDFGYAKLDMNATVVLTKHITAFTQLDNLLSQQHIGPIGYPGMPFTIRAGMKIRIGGD